AKRRRSRERRERRKGGGNGSSWLPKVPADHGRNQRISKRLSRNELMVRGRYWGVAGVLRFGTVVVRYALASSNRGHIPLPHPALVPRQCDGRSTHRFRRD